MSSEEYVDYDYSDENDEDNINFSFIEIENEVYNVFKILQKETEEAYGSSGISLLKHMNLSDVYKLMYPDYEAPF